MKLLLDSHTFLWAIQEPEELSESAKIALQDAHNTLLVSLATLWEIQIKSDLGKLKLTIPLQQMLQTETNSGRMQLLTITPLHIYTLSNLPMHHRDPFDRLLIAQSQVESAVFVTKDHLIAAYDISTLW
ncbi:type II toxin-antitoxin system VapC family toxin [Armatimonas sp.]|uniref:type II toxin-antitoxin system VapC family toxin n=1 Tax=Armatimonas sp. TaxID=1872638 RepID=UPI00286B2294|nr:type II toxin-antitoxin system VapC family toxin [Armatimonas sp.]